MSQIVMLMIQGVGPVCGELVVPLYEVIDTAGTSPSVTLKRPVMVGVVPGRTPQEKGQLGFNPYLEFAEEFETGIVFAADKIMHQLTPLPQVENAYRQNYTDSGLVLPPSGGLHRV